MEKYQNWTLNIKHLTEFLMSYVSAMEKGDKVEMDRPVQEIEAIFDQLYSTTSEENKKEEIINLILLGIHEKTLTHHEVATYTRELVIYGFR
ncbi:hypothetical protein BA768_01115 [Chryseobacterium sp. CBo1]|uniref:hypothetical protein n=1 Tax=Chryseobacterium sp. CBo1 TaxID=1869230 RepID=UPI00081054EF|nr:hypothetical protein [Chryseobacterium sp. CBo1]OCK53184.1 hypothetical protein BA768_01115 [Chryseobacterium sp. CBo1]